MLHYVCATLTLPIVTWIMCTLMLSLGLENEIDIMDTVLYIRNQRFGMVQTEVSEVAFHEYSDKCC